MAGGLPNLGVGRKKRSHIRLSSQWKKNPRPHKLKRKS